VVAEKYIVNVVALELMKIPFPFSLIQKNTNEGLQFGNKIL